MHSWVLLPMALVALQRHGPPASTHLLPVAEPSEQLNQALVTAIPQLVGIKPVGQLQQLHHLFHLRQGRGE